MIVILRRGAQTIKEWFERTDGCQFSPDMTDGVADQGNYVRRLINNDRARARSDQCPKRTFQRKLLPPSRRFSLSWGQESILPIKGPF